MKMRKLLATGVAATVAVTSLATVASAAEKSWSMAQTHGEITLSVTGGLELGAKYSLDEKEIEDGETLGISEEDTLIIEANHKDCDKVTGMTLKVTGIKGTRNSTAQTYEYKFTNYMDAAATVEAKDGNYGNYWALTAYVDSAAAGSFIPDQFVEITKVEITATATKNEYDSKFYDKLGSSEWGYYAAPTFAGVEGFDSNDLLGEIASISPWGYGYSSKTTKDTFPYIAADYTIVDGARVIKRHDVQLLSYSDGYWSSTNNGNGPIYDNTDDDQSYEGDDTTAGTDPKEFAGLASQVAEFFNKQTNGKITFKFTTAAGAAAGSNWNNGGIPSTQTGIKNFLGGASANDFALFINYAQTGSLQATTSIDAEAGSVEFDITAILEALGYQTLGTVDNIWFGLAKGLKYDDDHADGLYVEEVILSYDEDAEDDADIEDDADEDDVDEDDVDEDDADEDDVDLDEDDADEDDADADEDDADEDDADVAGDVVDDADEDDDVNPGTGVALAVVPALVAAAAVAVSKKRS